MSDIRMWSRDFLLEFIELYRSFPCLWKVKSAEYRDRIKKDKSYEALLVKYKEVDGTATLKTVKQKIDSIRGAFRKELKKVKESSKSGAGSEDIYKPHLWDYNNLLFLTDHETTRRGVGNLEDDEDADESNDFDVEHSEIETERETESPVEIQEDDLSDATPRQTNRSRFSSLSASSSRDVAISSSLFRSKSYPSKRSRADDILDKVDKCLDQSDDQFDIIGKNIAHKLRSLPAEVAVVTEKMINDILFESQMGNVNKNSKITIYNSTPYPPKQKNTPQHTFSSSSQQSQGASQFDAMSHTPLLCQTNNPEIDSMEQFSLGDYITL